MKRVCMLALFVGFSLAAHAQAARAQGAHESDLKSVTLYGPLVRSNDSRRALYSFKKESFGGDWDLSYGSLYVSEEHDWFQVSTIRGARTAFRDLGKHAWTDSFRVPFVEPFPVLKPGEQRRIVVDASGADGADGIDGAPGTNGANGVNVADGDDAEIAVRTGPPPALPSTHSRRPKNDGVPKVDPVFAKAVVGHIYVVRVVDETEDFYVLFRVESLVRGDNCTISWKRIPPPQAEAALRK